MRLVLSCPCQMSFTHGVSDGLSDEPVEFQGRHAGYKSSGRNGNPRNTRLNDRRGRLCVERLTYTMEKDGVLSISEDLENLLQFVA